MYSYIRNKEETNLSLLLTSMSDHKDMSKFRKTTVNSYDNNQNKFTFQVRTIVPPDLHQIQPRATQVWNCDEIGFDPNGKWNKVVCTLRFFQGEIMWRVKNGERAPFWCTLLILTGDDGKLFMSPIVVHQAKDYSQDLHHNILLDYKVHHTPSGYMDIDGWLKAMTQLYNICDASPVNNQIIFFNGHDSHFDDCSLIQIQGKKIQPFILKPGDSINDQPNGNGHNSKIKALYRILKAKWMLKYGTTRFQTHHMNSVLVETR